MLTRIVAAQTDSSLYNTVQPNKSTLAGGNGGSVTKASNTALLDNVAISRFNTDVFGSTVVDTNDVDSAGGTLAYNNQSPIAKRLTTKINGSSNSVLRSGALQPALIESVHYLRIEGEGYVDGVRTTKVASAVRSGHYNFNGMFDNGYPQHSDDYFLGSNGSSGDNAAKPSRSVPGSLTFKYASPTIQTQAYQAKTG